METESRDQPTAIASSRRARVVLFFARMLVVAGLAALFPRWWCGRGAAAWLANDLATQQQLADVVALRARRGVNPGDLHTGSAQFDGEWALVTNQMRDGSSSQSSRQCATR